MPFSMIFLEDTKKSKSTGEDLKKLMETKKSENYVNFVTKRLKTTEYKISELRLIERHRIGQF